MRWWVIVVTATLAVVVALNAPHSVDAQRDDTDCMERPLGDAEDYSVVTRNDFVEEYTDSEGKMAIGRDARVNGFGIASQIERTDPPALVLVVGRDLTFVNTGINTGNATFGRTFTPPHPGYEPPAGLSITKSAPPLWIPALMDGLVIRSRSWAALERTADVTGLGFDGGYLLKDDEPDLNVFDVDAETLTAARVIEIDVPAGATALINLPDKRYRTQSRRRHHRRSSCPRRRPRRTRQASRSTPTRHPASSSSRARRATSTSARR